MDEAPAQALRGKRDSSMRVAVEQLKKLNGSAAIEGEGGDPARIGRRSRRHACVSAGNTGALMAISRFVLKMLEGIDRPAIAAQLPNQLGRATTMLDLGANVDCSAQHLLQFAVMGSALVSVLEDKERPSIGLLNIGEEAIKGNDVVKEAAELIRATHLNFYGNVEGNDIYRGVVDVDRLRRLRRQRGAEDVRRRGADDGRLPARGVQPQPDRQVDGAAVLSGAQPLQAPHRSSHLQRRQPDRAARHRRQEPWIGRCHRIRSGHSARL